jgi:site-specific recombinase XerD
VVSFRQLISVAVLLPFGAAGLSGEPVSRKFAYYLRRAGLIGFKLHSLRHSFATILLSRGVDLYTVSRLLGRSDIRTSMIFAKARMDTLKEAVDRLELNSGRDVTNASREAFCFYVADNTM